MTRLSLAALLACLVLASCGGSSSNDKTGPSAPKPLLGVTSGALLDRGAPVAAELRVMSASGVTTLRAPFYWSHAQPYQSKGSFSETDGLVAATAREGIALLPIVVGTPTWAARRPDRLGSPPAGTGPYSRFLTLLIGRYGPNGSFWAQHGDIPKQPIREWQIWNEPDHLRYWSEQPYQRDYVRLAKAARAAVKKADPGARVVMAGFADRSWDAIASVYRAGAKGVFDIVAIHPYTFEVRNVLRIVELARQALRRAGDGNRPLWLTEVTWSSGRRPGHRPYPFETTAQDQAARLGQALPLLIRTRRKLGVERIFWENWISTDSNHANPFDYSGLRVLLPDGTVRPKPAFAAFKRVALDVKARPES